MNMKRVLYREFGIASEVCNLEEYQVTPPKVGYVNVKWLKSSINPNEHAIIRGLYKQRQVLPAVPGYEGVGIVEEVGDDVDNLKVGQKVIVKHRFDFQQYSGCWQPIGAFRASDLYVIDDFKNIDDNNLVAFNNSILSSWLIVNEICSLGAGDWLLINAAGSSLSRTAMQIANLLGIRVIGVIRNSKRKEEIFNLGATEVIATDQENVLTRVKTITKLKGVHAAIDSVGGDVGSECFRTIRDQGKFIVCGFLSGERFVPIDSKKLLFGNIKIYGFWVPEFWYSWDHTLINSAFSHALYWLEKGKIDIKIQETFRLEDIKEAIKLAENPKGNGKIILDIN